jgi:hypothetical protein
MIVFRNFVSNLYQLLMLVQMLICTNIKSWYRSWYYSCQHKKTGSVNQLVTRLLQCEDIILLREIRENVCARKNRP